MSTGAGEPGLRKLNMKLDGLHPEQALVGDERVGIK
jgi:hypothetical protein